MDGKGLSSSDGSSITKIENLLHDSARTEKKTFPKGIVLGRDGKPCRSCSSFAAWASMTKQNQATTNNSSSINTGMSNHYLTDFLKLKNSLNNYQNCPPSSEELGSSTWTLLHTITATYPEKASEETQKSAVTLLNSLSKLYPCWYCAEHFEAYISNDKTKPRVNSRAEFGKWMCDAHNEVNLRLGKPVFDCRRWEERWAGKGREHECG